MKLKLTVNFPLKQLLSFLSCFEAASEIVQTMIHGEQPPFQGADYYNESLLPFSVDQTSDMTEDDQCCYGDTILAANGFSEVHMNAVYNATESTQTDASPDIFNHIPLMAEPLTDHLSHWTPKEETVSSGTYMNMEWQQAESGAFPFQAVNTNNTQEFQSYLKGEVDTSHVSPKSNRRSSRKTREQSRESESRRRNMLSQRVQALQELLPPMKDKRNIQESTVQDAIGHIKYLQLQLKELSRSRLGGESSSGSLKFVEGYGHYHPHEEMLDEPLEEVIGRLFEENPAAVHELLKKKGLYMLPLTSAATCATEASFSTSCLS
ncbi:Transcription factor bHLH69 [Bienertia sinuspersici]